MDSLSPVHAFSRKSAKSVGHNSRRLALSLPKPTTTQFRSSKLPDEKDHVLEKANQYKTKKIIKDLLRVVDEYENDPPGADKQWRHLCGRYILCHGSKLTPQHDIGRMLKTRGTFACYLGDFFVAYAKMQSILDPNINQEHIRQELCREYGAEVVEHSQQSRRFFYMNNQTTPKRYQEKPAKFNKKGKSLSPAPLRRSKTSPKLSDPEVLYVPAKESSPSVNLKRYPPPDTYNRQPRSMTFKYFLYINGGKVKENWLKSWPRKSEQPIKPALKKFWSTVPLSQREEEIMREAGLLAVLPARVGRGCDVIIPNHRNRNVFGKVLVWRYFIPNDPKIYAIVNLRNFEQATPEDIEDMKQMECDAYYKVDASFYDNYFTYNQEL